MPTVRLNKLIAEAGLASRRGAERLLADGRVTVNGIAVREPGASADLDLDDIRVDGVWLRTPAEHSYWLLHKPAGVTTTLRDPHAERTIVDLLPPHAPRLYPVGRLDRESEGLLLLTDDGALTERLLHPRHGLEREYAVLVRGDISSRAIERVRGGTTVEGATVRPHLVEPIDATAAPTRPPPGSRWLRVVLGEGRKREVRVICAAAGLDVQRLVRVRFGPLVLGDLPPGAIRPLTAAEVASLRRLTTPAAAMGDRAR